MNSKDIERINELYRKKKAGGPASLSQRQELRMR